MDIKAYISSGVLEQYVLGMLSEQERGEVERYVMQYPELQLELSKIESALEQFAQAQQVPVRVGLKEEILDKIPDVPVVGTQMPGQDSVSVKHTIGRALAMSAFLSALVWGFWQYKEATTLKTSLSKAETDLQEVIASCEEEKAAQEVQVAYMNVLKDRQTKPVVMNGTEKKPDASAVIYWNGTQEKAFVDLGSLPAVPKGKQYQLWAIVDGKPLDMGVLDILPREGNFMPVPFIPNAQAFAVTLEPEGGNAAPTLEEMYVVGNFI